MPQFGISMELDKPLILFSNKLYYLLKHYFCSGTKYTASFAGPPSRIFWPLTTLGSTSQSASELLAAVLEVLRIMLFEKGVRLFLRIMRQGSNMPPVQELHRLPC